LTADSPTAGSQIANTHTIDYAMHIDLAVTSESRLFLRGHLFGPTVQWRVDPRTFELGENYQPLVSEKPFPAILHCEREAARYGPSRFHEIGRSMGGFPVTPPATRAYPLHLGRTGEKLDFRCFWNDQAPLVSPKPIPAFRAKKRALRMDGVVI
jgi:hypothetical protein